MRIQRKKSGHWQAWHPNDNTKVEHTKPPEAVLVLLWAILGAVKQASIGTKKPWSPVGQCCDLIRIFGPKHKYQLALHDLALLRTSSCATIFDPVLRSFTGRVGERL